MRRTANGHVVGGGGGEGRGQGGSSSATFLWEEGSENTPEDKKKGRKQCWFRRLCGGLLTTKQSIAIAIGSTDLASRGRTLL